tara:strand:+ start:1073 stop:1207 length:135 start_codon:yes stop_codon:yes gene_type:complete
MFSQMMHLLLTLLRVVHPLLILLPQPDHKNRIAEGEKGFGSSVK